MQHKAHHGKHILVVEDDTAIGEMLQMLLELEGYRVTVAMLANEALALLTSAGAAAGQIDLVLLDLQLPDMDGTQIASQFQQLVQPPPVIVTSARPKLAVQDAAAEIHAASFLYKPFEVRDLLVQIKQVFSAPTLANE